MVKQIHKTGFVVFYITFFILNKRLDTIKILVAIILIWPFSVEVWVRLVLKLGMIDILKNLIKNLRNEGVNYLIDHLDYKVDLAIIIYLRVQDYALCKGMEVLIKLIIFKDRQKVVVRSTRL